MSDLKDSAIKLFGKMIPLPLSHRQDFSSANESCSAAAAPAFKDFPDESTASPLDNMFGREKEAQERNRVRESSGKEITDDEHEDSTSNHVTEDSKDPTTSSDIYKKPTNSSAARETSPQKSSKNGEQSDTSISQEKTLKKPDKILPCARCNSMDTKFCYYNNYNVNQPRHFCKNCQRYWTAGGTMRNVPVGAGRRKNKSSFASHHRHIMASEALRTAQVHAVNGVHNPSLGNGSTVLSFGSDSPLYESVASILNLPEKKQNNVRNAYHRPEQRILISCGGAGDRLSGSSVTASISSKKGGNCGSKEVATNNHQGFPPQVPFFPGLPWSYPWSSPMPPSAFSPSGFPASLYPAPAYWGCTVPSPWNVAPCLSPQSPSLNHCAASSSPTSPLGKHSREGKILNPVHSEDPSRESNCSETSVMIPKTLRIDDPGEAAKCSMLATLGIKSTDKSSLNGGGLFTGFRSKNEDSNYMAEKSPLLHANPAALSRSLNFHEST
ncbi:hypothetical protein P3X46_002928 [Hevea brasiliensis]|uniref:Dof-type domain-containing protein n=1 Tax=Hevea brasiliensis TaxID=3981 RepID=A0ABQ9N5B6_HEVBR|nr:cyclic dof factor 1 [Hevea brasiliensis]XP_021691887.2 cyclic dof factor 1 [Hevea brasiliensis]KAJ9187473.1 hypothetical protein P3X46_002928 [Hevea brasiliensis]